MAAEKTKKIMVYFDDECLKIIDKMEKMGVSLSQVINDYIIKWEKEEQSKK